MTDLDSKTLLILPRGKPSLPDLQMDVKRIYEAEGRLREVAIVNPNTSQELSSFFNEVCNQTTKYVSWIEYEILQAQKNLDLIKAEIIVDRLPALAKELKETGQKPNEAWREAVIAKDSNYNNMLDILNALKAAKALLASKAKTFERAYFSAKDISKQKERVVATPKNAAVGELSEPQQNFMGVTQLK